MKSTKFDGVEVRQVLYGMIHNDVVLTRIASQWKDSLFDNDFANQIGSWCIRYMRAYQRAPKKEILRLLERWTEDKSPTDEIASATESFLLSTLSENSVDTAHLLDIAGNYFNRVRLKREIELAQNDLQVGELKNAKDRLRGLVSIELGEGSYVVPSNDYSVWFQSLEDVDDKSLVRYPGNVGEFFKGTMFRGEFYAFMAPDKTGKSAWLIDLSWRAIRARNRVAYFDTGDSDQDEVLRRFAQRISGLPDKRKECRQPIEWNNVGSDDNPDYQLDYAMEIRDPVDAQDVFRSLKKRTRSKDAFRLSCHANSSLSVGDLNSILIDWDRLGWRPDVLVIDYADIMAVSKGNDTLEQIDSLWKDLRRLSMERHCLLVTATQSNAAAYGLGKALLSRRNFSGRKTKLAHVNGMIGINVSADERATHQARLNWVVRRRWDTHLPKACVNVAGCYDVENPIILSRW